MPPLLDLNLGLMWPDAHHQRCYNTQCCQCARDIVLYQTQWGARVQPDCWIRENKPHEGAESLPDIYPGSCMRAQGAAANASEVSEASCSWTDTTKQVW